MIVQPMIKLNEGYDVIIWSSVDPQFGPAFVFGAGDSLVEIFQDRSIMLPPLTTTLARRMMESTKIYKALQGVRGRAPADLAGLEQRMVGFSKFIIENPRIKEFDINPLLVFEGTRDRSIVALDGRAVLYPSDIGDEDLPTTVVSPTRSNICHRGLLKAAKKF